MVMSDWVVEFKSVETLVLAVFTLPFVFVDGAAGATE